MGLMPAATSEKRIGGNGPGASGDAERRMAHPRAHPDGGDRGPARLGGRLPLSGGDRHGRRRPARPADRNRFLQRLCGGHLCSRGQFPSTVRFGAAIRPRASLLRRDDAVLRLALSAVLSLRRRRFGLDALWACAVRLAGDHARLLFAGDPRHPESLRPARRGSSKCGSALAPPRARFPGGADQCRARPQRLPHSRAIGRRAGHSPPAAAILFGLMAYKPQFGLMIPIALAAGGYWRTFAAAAATAVLLTLVTTLVFGVQVWHAFFVGAEFTRTVVLEQGDTGWHKIQGIFSWARMWGSPVPLAYAIQGAATLVFAMATAWLWHGKAPYPLKASGLCLAAILATPYTLDYDMMVL